MDPKKFTQKTQEAIKNAAELAQDNSNAQISPVHLAISLFEDPEGLAKQAVMREGSDETLRSILRVLRKKLVRLPAVDPPPEQVRKDSQHSCKVGDLNDSTCTVQQIERGWQAIVPRAQFPLPALTRCL